MNKKASYFVFEKREVDEITADVFLLTHNLNTRFELKTWLNRRLKDGVNAEDFLIIHGREERITAVKVIAELETVVEPEPEPTRG